MSSGTAESRDINALFTVLVLKHCVFVSVLQMNLSAVLHVMSTEVVRKICCVFKELFTSLEKETEALRNKVKHLESELKSAKSIRTQTVHETKPSGQCFKR